MTQASVKMVQAYQVPQIFPWVAEAFAAMSLMFFLLSWLSQVRLSIPAVRAWVTEPLNYTDIGALLIKDDQGS